jgi:hypothetical protein
MQSGPETPWCFFVAFVAKRDLWQQIPKSS